MAKPKSQIQKFRDAARKFEADESEERFNATLKGLAKNPREAEAGEGKPLDHHTTKNGKSQP